MQAQKNGENEKCERYEERLRIFVAAASGAFHLFSILPGITTVNSVISCLILEKAGKGYVEFL